MRGLIVVGVLASGHVAYAEPRPSDDCGSSIYLEASGFLAASTAGVAQFDRAALGYLYRSCDSDIHVRFGGTGHVRFGRLGFGPNSGSGGSSLFGAGGVELEVAKLFGDHRIGARVGVESYGGELVAFGLRWRADHFSLAADVFTAMADDYVAGTNPAEYHHSTSPGVMVGAGVDGHAGGGVAIAILGGVLAVLFVGLVFGVAAASG